MRNPPSAAEMAKIKADLAAVRQREAEQGPVELMETDLELLPDEPETKPEKLSFAVAEAGSQGEIKATTEYKAVDQAAMLERRINEAKKVVAEMLKIRDADSLRDSLEGKLQSAEDKLEDLDEDQDAMRAAAQLEADVINAQLQELDRILAAENEQAA